MLCDVCGKREAKIYYTEIINGKKTEQHLCEECAAEHTSFRLKDPFSNKEFTLGGLLSGILDSYNSTGKEKDEKQHVACKTCGLTYEEFLQKECFGCKDCYHSFGKLLNKTFKRIHGAETHTGKKPKGYVSETNRILNELPEVDKLSIQLQQAIEQEAFEEAAKLRDRIRELRKNNVQKVSSREEA